MVPIFSNENWHLALTLHSQRQQRIISAYKQVSCKLVAVITAEPSYYINYAIKACVC